MRYKFVVFTLNEQRYAVELSAVQRIVRIVEVTPLPKAPEIVLGVINLQGIIIAVFDIRKRFGLHEAEMDLSDQLIIARTATRTVALAVDSVSGIIERSEEEITESGRFVPGSEYLEGVAKVEDSILLIHNLDRFLCLEEEKQLQEVLAKS
jgi:purine-binding chemotaxis protein CheW